MKTTFFWFRRDLRLNDNTGLIAALKNSENVQPLFIFDETILSSLPEDDARVTFIWDLLSGLNEELKAYKSSVLIKHGAPKDVWESLTEEFEIDAVYTNRDYEPTAIERDETIEKLLSEKDIEFKTFKDHVFFEYDEVLKGDGDPYVVYTPYKNKWLEAYHARDYGIPEDTDGLDAHYAASDHTAPSLEKIGFKRSEITVPEYSLKDVSTYNEHRDFPGVDKTTRIGHHLRFGTVSVRSVVYFANKRNQVFLSEIIWRDFFAQILYHFQHVVDAPFRAKYRDIPWRNNEADFEKWCKGETGYPIVDAGMRQLNQTGFMHNRVRMVVASFLVKHLLIDWRWGEAYFAEKLLDFDLSSNNGNWQWAAGTGCDASPYFRVFNPTSQQEKFDKNKEYIKEWVPEYGTEDYPEPMVEHKMARLRAIDKYKEGIQMAEG